MCRSKKKITQPHAEIKGQQSKKEYFSFFFVPIVSILCLGILCSSCAKKSNSFVVMNPQQVQFIQGIKSDYEKLLGLSRDEVLLRLGAPIEQKTFVRNAVERERFVYYLYHESASDEKKVLEVYFVEEKVSGFNVIYGDQYDDVKDRPLANMKTIDARMQ